LFASEEERVEVDEKGNLRIVGSEEQD
jgi:hypothetical protein